MKCRKCSSKNIENTTVDKSIQTRIKNGCFSLKKVTFNQGIAFFFNIIFSFHLVGIALMLIISSVGSKIEPSGALMFASLVASLFINFHRIGKSKEIFKCADCGTLSYAKATFTQKFEEKVLADSKKYKENFAQENIKKEAGKFMGSLKNFSQFGENDFNPSPNAIKIQDTTFLFSSFFFTVILGAITFFMGLIPVTFIIVLWSTLVFKANFSGVIIDIENDIINVPGGGISFNTIGGSARNIFQSFKRYSFKISDIQAINTHQTISITQKGHISQRHFITLLGTFGAVKLSFPKEKRDQVYTLIAQISEMGIPVVNR